MKRTIHIIILFAFLHLVSCQKSHEDEIRKKYVAEWKSTKKPFPFKGILKIKVDNTFEYNTGACTSRSYSKGIWKIENDTLVLNSFKPKECCFLKDFGILEKIKFVKPGEETFKAKKSIKDCEPNGNDSYEVFENVKFYRKDAVLVFKSKSKSESLPDFLFDNNFVTNR